MKRNLVGIFISCLISIGSVHASIPEEDKDALFLFMKAAVDRDCDGTLEDEKQEDRVFATQKSLSPSECVIYRTEYRNDGSFPIRHLRVTNKMPNPMRFMVGSAQHRSIPPGLRPETPLIPQQDRGGELIWRFSGSLGPGEQGILEFRARLEP